MLDLLLIRQQLISQTLAEPTDCVHKSYGQNQWYSPH